jgi:long-chain fatty acid transport protein
MKSIQSRIVALFVPICLLVASGPGARSALANGFFIQEMSAAGMGQAGALVAAGERASTQFQNAANLAVIPGFNVELTGTIYFPTGWYESPRGDRTSPSSTPIFVPYFFASYKINDWLAVGLAEFTDFGLSIGWPENWEGRHVAIESGIQSFTLNPNVAFGPFRGLSFAVGFNAKYAAVNIRRGLTLGQDPPGSTAANTVEIGGDAWGFGANVGLLYQPVDWVRLGVAYRSGMRISARGGKMDFDVNKAWASRFPDQTFDIDIDLPHVLFAGVRFWPMKNLSMELDVQWVQWSAYDNLEFRLDKGLVLGPDAVQKTMIERKDYKDAFQVRLGGEYKFYNDHFALRMGFLWDQNPAPEHTVDPTLPDSERLIPTISFGTQWSGFFVDVGYMPVFGLKRKVRAESGNPFPGTYQMITHDLSITVGYHFDPKRRKASVE